MKKIVTITIALGATHLVAMDANSNPTESRRPSTPTPERQRQIQRAASMATPASLAVASTGQALSVPPAPPSSAYPSSSSSTQLLRSSSQEIQARAYFEQSRKKICEDIIKLQQEAAQSGINLSIGSQEIIDFHTKKIKEIKKQLADKNYQLFIISDSQKHQSIKTDLHLLKVDLLTLEMARQFHINIRWLMYQ